MVRLIKAKLEGSTLVEVLIAMVIIVVVFAIAMRVFFNVMNTGVSYQSVKVQSQMKVLAQRAMEQGDVSEDVLTIDSIDYLIKVLPTETEGLMQMEVSATQRGRNFGTYNCLFMDKAKHGKD